MLEWIKLEFWFKYSWESPKYLSDLFFFVKNEREILIFLFIYKYWQTNKQILLLYIRRRRKKKK